MIMRTFLLLWQTILPKINIVVFFSLSHSFTISLQWTDSCAWKLNSSVFCLVNIIRFLFLSLLWYTCTSCIKKINKWIKTDEIFILTFLFLLYHRTEKYSEIWYFRAIFCSFFLTWQHVVSWKKERERNVWNNRREITNSCLISPFRKYWN
jgi:hypothetical protein